MHRPGIALLLATFAISCSDTPNAPPAPARVNSTAAINADGEIPGHYVVAVANAADPSAVALAYGLQPKYVYEHAINGFAGAIPDLVAQQLANDPRVVRVSVQRQMRYIPTAANWQGHATWGIDRIDQRALPLDSLYRYDYTGAGVSAYIIDTGILLAHSQFENRAIMGWDAYASDPSDALLGYNGSGDCEGHGTHVSGTVGGRTWGVAKRVRLVAVRVLNCAGYGSDADVIAGMDWVAARAKLPAVVNMSLGDVIPSKTMGISGPVDDAVKGMVAAGITVAVAAGNGWGNGTIGADACMFPIANVPEAITVAASTRTDTRTTWTNYGACIDVFGPGSSITSADIGGGSSVKSGTSMATPHVAGVAALILEQSPGATPQEVRNYLVNGATPNIILPTQTNNFHTMNSHLLYSRMVVPVAERKSLASSTACTLYRKKHGLC